MLNFIGAGIGILAGVILARYRGGNRADMAQYGAVFAIIGFLVGTIAMFVLPAPT
ncbi:hypothetical protein [Gymnodinialimonas sp.]